jgi:predicted enzyme related to lactoylglutathione lyase
VTEVERALAFYRDAFGWERSAAEIHEYVVLEVPEGASFGVSLIPQAAGVRGGGPTIYFAVDEPEEIAARAVAAGGRKRFGPTRFPGYGAIWQVEDPDGNRFGLFKR